MITKQHIAAIAATALAMAPLSALAHSGHGYEAAGSESFMHFALSPLHYMASLITISVVVGVSFAIVNRLVHRTITQPADIQLDEAISELHS